MPSPTALGEYLRARRALVNPRDVGLTHNRRRRVPGLRREELATLAGISSDYYLRLEQGRDHHPSAQVIDALAQALQLDQHATAHLHALARSQAGQRQPDEPERVPSSIERLLTLWSATPAFVHGRYLDVLAANALALALSPAFSPGVNFVRATFLDADVRKLVVDWHALAQGTVARLRALVGPDDDAPRLIELIAELSARSGEFRRLWARHDVQLFSPRTYVFNHPIVGPLELKPERFALLEASSQVLIVCHAESGSPSEHALLRLADLSAGEHRRRNRHAAPSRSPAGADPIGPV